MIAAQIKDYKYIILILMAKINVCFMGSGRGEV